MFWWWLYMPQHHWPLSGAVTQDIETALLRQARDSRVEREVLSDVASYGRQLGVLTDVVLALARAADGETIRAEAGDALDKLEDIARRVEAIKRRRAPRAEDLQRALDELRRRDPAAWRELLAGQQRLLPAAPALTK
jgi:hypothetical protein